MPPRAYSALVCFVLAASGALSCSDEAFRNAPPSSSSGTGAGTGTSAGTSGAGAGAGAQNGGRGATSSGRPANTSVDFSPNWMGHWIDKGFKHDEFQALVGSFSSCGRIRVQCGRFIQERFWRRS
jgi:hypothetical protein